MIDIADYIGKTYGQMLDMVSSAAKVSAVTGAVVTANKMNRTAA